MVTCGPFCNVAMPRGWKYASSKSGGLKDENMVISEVRIYSYITTTKDDDDSSGRETGSKKYVLIDKIMDSQFRIMFCEISNNSSYLYTGLSNG